MPSATMSSTALDRSSCSVHAKGTVRPIVATAQIAVFLALQALAFRISLLPYIHRETLDVLRPVPNAEGACRAVVESGKRVISARLVRVAHSILHVSVASETQTLDVGGMGS